MVYAGDYIGDGKCGEYIDYITVIPVDPANQSTANFDEATLRIVAAMHIVQQCQCIS
jgi:hypothetical protein